MTFDNLLYDRNDAVALITLNRPSVLNALNLSLLNELEQALAVVQQDSEIGALVITGAGERAFAAGADIRELAALPDARDHARFGQRVFNRLAQLGKPVIAAVNGLALGGGCELALACTLRIASDSARLGQPEINLGLLPGFGGTQRLPRLIGRGRALDLLLSGRVIAAADALDMGLVDCITPATDLMSSATAWAADLASKPRGAVRSILDAVNRGMEMPLAQGLDIEAELFGALSKTHDMMEGTSAFLEKRAPRFTDR